MVTNQFVLMPNGAAVLVSTSAEEVQCPHCHVTFALEEIVVEAGCMAVRCPHCDQKSLMVRLVSVLHRAVRWPGELLERLRNDEVGRASKSIKMPEEVFSLSVSRGAVALLAMLWHRAERAGSRSIESSITQLAQRQLSSRGMVRRWLSELNKAGALREVTPEGSSRQHRQWELLSLRGEEDGDAE